ncbi:aspartate aminotransferase family protein [Pollutimonas thiosulfatoxidans]|uniref:Acetylornithine aminotransferase n=1 Tax=Pollutimonas thiosulfatoxidans TaxID=2028345 RepID=A0A410GG67_9BURK|nr:aspartate aminotransferase family protein [Pollutimonas thiosulfatoxidans]MBF6618115.1 aspartate aminotransferase family protein [Candidimonas sp.]QAA95297.1 acetylornithine transaminase [Pollutimonas thiosulfatoxidans]
MSSKHLMDTYRRAPLAFSRGEGIYLYTDDATPYMDLTSGIGVNNLGYSHPHIVRALTEQAGKLWHVSNQFRIPGQERLADRLCEASFADRAFFANSGAEAVECALKLARRYFDVSGQPDRWRTIVFDGAFHGRTFASIMAGDGEQYREGYAPHMDGFDRAQFGNLDSVRALIRENTAAIMVEPVQGEGGVRAASAEFLAGLRQLADEYGLLLILDEVQSGNGRTGKLYCHEWSGITPDIMATAKGLGAGFPMAVCLATEAVSQGFGVGNHGTTFGGNPLAMAVGNAVLDVLTEPGFLDSVQDIAVYLRKGLTDLVDRHPALIRAPLRGSGLMIGLPAIAPNTEIVSAFRQQGVLALTARDNIVRLLPPLVITRDQVDAALHAMDAALAGLAA